jgi:hypothetical protein
MLPEWQRAILAQKMLFLKLLKKALAPIAPVGLMRELSFWNMEIVLSGTLSRYLDLVEKLG